MKDRISMPFRSRINIYYELIKIYYETNRPYKHPMIEWNQNKNQISIKVFLANAKELTVNYGTQTVIFRTRLNEIDYGFDFELFDQIDEERCRFATDNKNYIMIYLQKKTQIEWTRLLHTFYKVLRIKFISFLVH
jgi:hypothetical protein